MLRWTEAVQNEREKPEKQDVMMSNSQTGFELETEICFGL